MSPDLELALRLADAADAISLPRFRSGLAVETKADLTPVTEADRAVESELQTDARRASGPTTRSSARSRARSARATRRWIVDPIDGTRNYSRGIPVWATLIALEEDGVVRLGVVSAPALRGRWWAERGSGAFANGEPHPRLGRRHGRGRGSLVLARAATCRALARRAWHARGLGDFWAHMLVAEGAVDGAVDARRRERVGSRRGAGDRRGGGRALLRLRGRSRGSTAEAAVSSNGLLHDELLSAIQDQTAPA